MPTVYYGITVRCYPLRRVLFDLSGNIDECVEVSSTRGHYTQTSLCSLCAQPARSIEAKVTKNAVIDLSGGVVVFVDDDSENGQKYPNTISIDLQDNFVCPELPSGHQHLSAVGSEVDLEAMKDMSGSFPLLCPTLYLPSNVGRRFYDDL
ncbi:hypothetical protein K461DRAFT_266738 [Myriangium duriaei CBS 260.36]|uniref:Uncharacterized protein n=1 Tax=Myriangium duriaei CBS 260.36 TaxID=1168546 RepID=A0A9P4J4V8_9PEZI|nr:hypothetical protein K461DRAFT_266738 [Myriangium duriaei CBS 260.36]